MHAIDANVLVRLVARDDAKQVETAEAFAKNGAWVSHLALAEAIWALDSVYRLRASAIANAIEMLVNHRSLVLESPEVVGSALQHYRRRPALGFSDCLMLEVARKAGHLPLGTFDRALGGLPGAERL